MNEHHYQVGDKVLYLAMIGRVVQIYDNGLEEGNVIVHFGDVVALLRSVNLTPFPSHTTEIHPPSHGIH